MLIPFAQNSAKVRYFYTFQTDHKPSDNVTIQRHYIVTKFPMLYISYFAHLFCSWKLVFLNLPHLFLSSLHPAPLWQPPVCSLSITLFLFYIYSFVLLFQISHMSEINKVFVSVILLSTIPSKSIHVVANGKISFFLMAE